jgi:translation initiation factor IF-2
MRVYEFAKQLDKTSKDILAVLKEAGHAVSNHMAVLGPDLIELLNKKFSIPVPTPQPVKQSSKVQTKQQVSTPTSKTQAVPPVIEIQKQEHKPSVEPVVLPSAAQETKPIITKFIAPANVEFDDDREAREQERIKRLLSASNIVGVSAFVQAPAGARRRRRRRPRVVAQKEAVKAPVTQLTIDAVSMPVCDVAALFGRHASELITALLKKGVVCNLNNLISIDVIRSLADQFKVTLTVNSLSKTAEQKIARVAPANGTFRAPVVVVMGHVDHGKTTLLDFIRKMNVAASEKGGITQHVRAWEVDTALGKIVFLDTPGHEAFSYMRQQGSKITDIAILVVAADDGIMPQTIEAIQHAKNAGVPIIVAINKIDKVTSPSAIETIKRQLSQHDLMPEDWGGQTVIAPISAKTGDGVAHLLEMIVLQSQMMELKAPADVPGHAFIFESHVEKGLGPVATVICREGKLRQGDYFTAGQCTGKIRVLINTYGKKVTEVGPSIPAQVVGFDSVAGLGEDLLVVTQQAYNKARSEKIVEHVAQNAPAATRMPVAIVQQTALSRNKVEQKNINLIVKTDTRGSKEAVMGSIDKVVKANKEIKCPIVIVNSGIGDITESDIELAENTSAIIVGLHVKTEKNAQALAKEMGISVQLYGIIYELIDYLTKLLLSKKEAVYNWNKVGEASVLKVFDIKGVGVIAGCYLREGIVSRGNKAECFRGGKKIGEGKISSLQRDRKTVKEVHAGYECGFTVDGFTEFQEGDTVICFAEVKVD